MWTRVWEWVHGPVALVPAAQVREVLVRMSELESAARHLGALEDIEEQREDRR
jgi:hypothetical protein